MFYRYGGMLWLLFFLLCVNVMVMSYAYGVSCSRGCGMSDVYKEWVRGPNIYCLHELGLLMHPQ